MERSVGAQVPLRDHIKNNKISVLAEVSLLLENHPVGNFTLMPEGKNVRG
jgi:hypothetical protein